MRRLVSALAAVCCFGQISAPKIGFVTDRSGALRPVFGVAGTFVLGDAAATGVLSAASTERHTLAKTAGEVLLLSDGQITNRISAPEGLASFGFDEDGRAKWVRFANGDCLVWESGSAAPGTCPAAEQEARVEGDELVLKKDGARVRVPAGAQRVEAIGPGWLGMRTASGIYAVRTESGREAVFAIPEAKAEVEQ